jgi:hypothetical protein
MPTLNLLAAKRIDGRYTRLLVPFGWMNFNQENEIKNPYKKRMFIIKSPF